MRIALAGALGVALLLATPARADTAYLANWDAQTVTPIDLATKTMGAPIPVGEGPQAIAIAPDGATAYVVNDGSDDVTPIDAGTNAAGAPIPVGPVPSAIAIAPAQAPIAAFDTAPAPSGSATRFDASASVSPRGAIAAYEWSFGDGATLATSSPTAQHVYAAPGRYTATLTVRNGCDPDAIFTGGLVFTGQTASCAGPPTAQASRQLSIPACQPPSVSSTNFVPARRVTGRQVPGVRVRIAVGSPAQLEIAAKLSFRRNDRARTVSLGSHSLGNPGARNLRLPLPKALPLGTKVRLALTISAPDGCGAPQVSHASLRTRVVRVLVAGS